MKIILGDVVDMAFTGKFDVIIQGCNCFCQMGRGLAKTIKETCLEAVEADNKTKAGDRSKLGTFSVGCKKVSSEHTFAIVNAYMQYHRNEPEGQDLVDYAAVRKIMQDVAQRFPDKRIGIPLIGANLARGNWGIIERIILEELALCDVTIVHFADDFQSLFTQFEEATRFSSNLTHGVESIPGKRLLAADKDAVLKHLFQYNVPLTVHIQYFLAVLTEHHVRLKKEDAGDLQKMAASWRNWARENGYLH